MDGAYHMKNNMKYNNTWDIYEKVIKSFNLETHETRTESDQIVFAPETKLRIKYTCITHAV